MVTLATITYKNQLTIPNHIIEQSGLKETKKVLIVPKKDGFFVKPVISSLELLAGSLHKAGRKFVGTRKERELTQKIVARETAKEGLPK